MRQLFYITRILLVVIIGLLGIFLREVVAQSYLEIDSRVIAIEPRLAEIQEQIKRDAMDNALDEFEQYDYTPEEEMFSPTGQEMMPVQPPVMMPPPTPMPPVQEEIFIPQSMPDEVFTPQPMPDEVFAPQPMPDEVFTPRPMSDEMFVPQEPQTAKTDEDIFAPQALMGDEMALFQDMPMVFSASKKAQPINEAPVSVYVITQEQIRQNSTINLWDLLREVPGMDVTQSTTGQADVSMRGFNDLITNKILVLVDGRSIYSPLQGFQLWESIPVQPEEIERIEIIKGPVASMYGANANLGLINIITKRAGSFEGTTVSVTQGNLKTGRYSVVHSGKHKRLSYKLSSGWKEENTHDPVPDVFSTLNLGTKGADGLDAVQQNAEFIYEIDDETNVLLSGGYASSTIYFLTSDANILGNDLFYGPFPNFTRYTKAEFNKKDFTLKAYWNHTEYEYTALGLARATDATVDTVDIEARNIFELNDKHSLTVGGGGRYDLAESNTFDAKAGASIDDRSRSQSLWNVYFQDDLKLTEKLSVNTSARVDTYPISDYNASGRFAIIHHPNANDTFRLSAGYSFRNPTLSDYFLNDTVFFGLATVIGNEFVKPERYVTYEASYQRAGGKFRPFVDYFWTKITGQIGPELTGTVVNFRNLNEAYSQGVEAGVEWDIFKGGTLIHNYAFNHVSYPEQARTQFYSPEHKLINGFRLKAFDEKLSTKFMLHHIWPTTRLVTGPTLGVSNFSLPSYTLANAWIGYKIHPNAELSISGFNLLYDEHIEFVAGDRIGQKVLGKLEIKF